MDADIRGETSHRIESRNCPMFLDMSYVKVFFFMSARSKKKQSLSRPSLDYAGGGDGSSDNYNGDDDYDKNHSSD